MAVRFPASGEYTRALSAGSISQYTVTCWIKISTDRNDFSAFWGIDNGSSDQAQLLTNSDGTTLLVGDESASRATGPNMTVGTWYYAAVSVNGAAGTLLYRAATASSFTAVTWTGGSATLNAANLHIGNDESGLDPVNGCVAAFKLWIGATLTQAEMENEAWTYVPQRTSGIKAWYPFTRAETTDYSGQGQTLSGGSGSSTEDGPPVAWSTALPTLALPVSVSATVSATTIEAAAATPAPTLTTGSSVSPTAVAAVAAIPAPSTSTGLDVVPTTVSAVAATPTPTVSTGEVESVVPTAVTAAAALPPPDVSAGSTAAPAAVSAVAAVPMPALSSGVVVTLTTIEAVARVPLPSITVPILPGDLISGDYQIEINTDLLLGPDVYRIIAVTGWDDLVGLDVGNVMRPSRHGAWPGRKLAQERILTADIVIDDQDDFVASMQALRRATAVPDDDSEIPIVVRTREETLIAYGAIDGRILPPDTWYAGVAQGSLRWRCADPRRYSLTVGSIVIDNGSTGAAANNGDTLTHPVVRIAGPATNPSIYNASTDRTLAFTIVLSSDDTLIVDTNAGSVRAGAEDQMSALSPLSVPVEEWHLQMGTNVITYSATAGGSAGVEVQWRSAYL